MSKVQKAQMKQPLPLSSSSVEPPLPASSVKQRKPAALGQRIKTFRIDRQWTLAEMSRRTGLAQSTLSKIENDQMSPTFDVLQKLVNGMDIDLADFLASPAAKEAPGRRSVDRADANEVRSYETANYNYVLLAAELAHKQMLPLKARIKARDIKEFDGWNRHDGEEILYVLSGEVMFHTEFYEPTRLKPGDSIYIDSRMGHACLSLSKEDAQVLWVHVTGH